MRPISQTTTKKLSHCRQDDATLYASLELSQATWELWREVGDGLTG